LKKIKIGTPSDELALYHANQTLQQLSDLGIETELTTFPTQGNQSKHFPFDKSKGEDNLTGEIEKALLSGEVDFAVHALQDLPTTQPNGLVLAGVSKRESPAEWLLMRKNDLADDQLFSLKEKATVGVSSTRRKAQMFDFRPDVVFKEMTGNESDCLENLRKGNFDAIILAGENINYLGLDVSDLFVLKFNPREFIPAPAQGILAYQCCEADLEIRRLLKQLHRPETTAVSNVERKILKLMGGDLQMPIGVYCEQDANSHYHVWAAYAQTWDAQLKRVRLSSSTNFNLAERVVEMLNE
jgi:hydroxymethylbilane synthase